MEENLSFRWNEVEIGPGKYWSSTKAYKELLLTERRVFSSFSAKRAEGSKARRHHPAGGIKTQGSEKFQNKIGKQNWNT